MSFSHRLTLAAAGAVAAAILILSGITYVIVRDQLRGQVDNALRQAANRFDRVPGPGTRPAPVGAPAGAPPPGILHGIPPGPDDELGGARGYWQLVTAGGDTLRARDAQTVLPVNASTLAIASGYRGESLSDATVAGTHLRILTEEGTAAGTAIQIARPLTETDAVLSRLRWILLLVVIAGVALAAAAGLVVARSALAPVRRLTDTAEHVADTQDLSQRIDAGDKDELGRLGGAFNRMLDALGRSRQAQQQLVADASHELRTPLTSMRANVELLQAGDRLSVPDREATLRDLVSQTDELTGLVGDLVDLAREGQTDAPHDVVRLDELVHAAVARVRLRAPWMVFEDSDTEPTEALGDRGALERAVVNLLDNAVKFSNGDGAVEVTVHGSRITVRDHGPGIAEDDLPLVFDRFYRSAEARSRPGSGLGLAIVRQVAEAHGGSVTAQNAQGGGTLLTIDLPTLEQGAVRGSRLTVDS
jgi:two-component system sensor histidine kinase MprB